jgi:hypothetical protein
VHCCCNHAKTIAWTAWVVNNFMQFFLRFFRAENGCQPGRSQEKKHAKKKKKFEKKLDGVGGAWVQWGIPRGYPPLPPLGGGGGGASPVPRWLARFLLCLIVLPYHFSVMI